MGVVDRLELGSQLEENVEMDLLFGAFSFDDDPVQDGGHQIGVDTVFKGQLLFQCPPNLFGVQCGFLLPPLLCPDRRQLGLQSLDVGICRYQACSPKLLKRGITGVEMGGIIA